MKKVAFLCLLNLVCIGLFSQKTNSADTLKVIYKEKAGFYSSSLKVDLTSNINEAAIYFTTDGSNPNKYSKKFKEPFEINKTTVIRSIAVLKDLESRIHTNTYFINTNHKLPVVSISTTPLNLWDSTSGIYTKGCCASEFAPYKGANFWKNKEVKATIEYFNEEKSQVINQLVDIRIFGGFSRSLPQKSLAIIAKKEYGDKRLSYPFFKTKPEIKKFKSLVLRNSGGDFNKSNIRDAFLTHLSEGAGLTVQAYQPVVMYLNGEYWGIQNLREKINEHFIESNFGVDKDSVDIVRHRYDLQHGSTKEYHKLLAFLQSNNFRSNNKIIELSSMMNIDNYLRHHIAEVYFDDQDASGNVRYWRKKGANNQWNWVLFDTDLSYGINNWKGYKNNTLELYTTYSEEKWPNPHWATFIIRKLLENDSIKNTYVNITLDALSSAYSPEVATHKLDSISNLIRDEVPSHSKRWGRNPKYWEQSIAVMITFAQKRPQYLREHLRSKFNLKDTCTIKVLNDNTKGALAFNTLKKVTSLQGVYFTDRFYYLKVIPSLDYNFLGWENELKTKEDSVFVTKDVVITPIYKLKKQSNHYKKLIINELSCVDKNNYWVEFYNNSDSVISINNWILSSSDHTRTFSLGDVPPRSYVVFNSNKTKWLSFKKQDSIKIYCSDTLPVTHLVFDFSNRKKEDRFLALNLPIYNTELSEWKYAYKKQTPGEHNAYFSKVLSKEKELNQNLTWLGIFIICLGSSGVVFMFKKRPSEKGSNKTS